MAQSAADRPSRWAHNAAGSACVPSVTPVHYLKTIRTLLVAYQRASGVQQQQIFVNMTHAFMQDLCGYPSTSYRVTTAAHGHAEVGSSPHVVPTLSCAHPTLFYFTPAEHPDDVHDLWVKHAQVYLMAPPQGDVAAACATRVVFTNFFLIDGASKDPKTGAWLLWSVSDIEVAQGTRIDLRILESETALAPTMSHVIHKRLQTLHYQSPPNAQEPAADESEALAEVRPTAHREGHSA
jgi:hypothetical protein